jgi:hypothetical protein
MRSAVGVCNDLIEINSTALCRAKALTARLTMMSVTSKVLVSKNCPVNNGFPAT